MLFFIPSARRNTALLFVISLLINVGMWTERFVIIAGSLARHYNRTTWGDYGPSWVEWSILLGSLCWFLFWFLLFIRHLPGLPIAEVKEAMIHGSPAGDSLAAEGQP